MRKTKYLFDAIVRQKKSVTYYALDLSEDTLRQGVEEMASAFPSIHVVGLLGTYDDSLAWINENLPNKRKTVLWLGSSIGNFTREDALNFVDSLKSQAMGVGDQFLIGIDRRNDSAKIELAYNDPAGITRDFIMNGLSHINKILGKPSFEKDAFEYVSLYNSIEGRHEAYYKSKKNQTIHVGKTGVTVDLKLGELIHIEYSHK